MIESINPTMIEKKLTPIEHVINYRDIFLNNMFPPLENTDNGVIEEYSGVTKERLNFVATVRSRLRLHSFFTEEAMKFYYNLVYQNPVVRDMMFEYALMLRMYLLDHDVYDASINTIANSSSLIVYDGSIDLTEKAKDVMSMDCFVHSSIPYELYNEISIHGKQDALLRLQQDPLALAGISFILVME